MMRPLICSLMLLATAVGCRDEATEIAREAADRQARQSDQIAQMAQAANHATERLVTEESQARRELLAAERSLHRERAQLFDSWNELEERRQAAARRERGAVAGQAIAAALATLLALAIACRALASRSTADLDAACWLLDESDHAGTSLLGPRAEVPSQLPHSPQETRP